MGRFWEEKSLKAMSRKEWESLCDGCARCCLIKLEDDESGELYTTAVACRYLEFNSCRCSVYTERTRLVPDCVQITRENIDGLYFMPQSCAYRLLAEGRPLPEWHPLLSGDDETVRQSGIAVCSFAISEEELTSAEDLEAYIIG
ncbi:MAG: YcgN family cysteine cluster protein [Gammaproteobacteria bacterium]|nr:YcgN family cysteine cluster protein [Gammaproteobacteria bacterium]MCW8841396.1 YcgN family cysteine cluster protein [Gammaproteobacteria bacterium]MCW8957556.1 YcgN family cysteine cluster protein [Gammaproteobacteria bacterium]MCW8973819.1 YcgN family cysteine cluster protein [Gammaproteobacteria bacterium]MCW8993964.1 YcgN family cysteine cluster protein [Gammaproteobacteria bacterium]